MFMSPYIGPWPQKSSIPWQNLEVAYCLSQTTGSVLSCSGFSNFMFSILLYILRVKCSLCAIFHSLILIHECIFLNCYLITLFFPKNDSIFHSHVRILEFMKPHMAPSIVVSHRILWPWYTIGDGTLHYMLCPTNSHICLPLPSV